MYAERFPWRILFLRGLVDEWMIHSCHLDLLVGISRGLCLWRGGEGAREMRCEVQMILERMDTSRANVG